MSDSGAVASHVLDEGLPNCCKIGFGVDEEVVESDDPPPPPPALIVTVHCVAMGPALSVTLIAVLVVPRVEPSVI